MAEDKDMNVTNIEIVLTLNINKKVQVVMNTDEKKLFVSMLLNFFKDGIEFTEIENKNK